MLTRLQAGLFSAVTSAFIIDVQSKLQSDPNDETAALLRVLIHKIDNTTFGNDPPSIPQWTGPPHTIVQVQAILYMSLAASLLSAFLAMLGKQWLNRYASTDMRGTAIERSQDRQRKLDGIVTWYFDHVMESLPLMLQAALLLLGCALSCYLWDIDITVASVVIAVTSLSIIFYIFIIIAGTASESCPYQTPGSHAIRYLWPQAKRILHSAIRHISRKSKTVQTIKGKMRWYNPLWPRSMIPVFLKSTVSGVAHAIAIDAYHLGWVMVWAPTVGIYHLTSAIVIPLVSHLHGTSSTSEQGSDLQLPALDLRCISWMLQTSLDKDVHLSTLKHLTTMMPLTDFDPTLVMDCFNVVVGCISVSKCKAVIVEGLEQLAVVSTMCFLRAFHQLSAMDLTSSVCEDVRQHHKKAFPVETDFGGLLWYTVVIRACGLTDQHLNLHCTQWDNFGPSSQQLIPVMRAVAEASQVECRGVQHQKVSRQILRFTLCTLSIHPPPPTSIIVDCLSIIAIDLGCDISSIGTTLTDRCVCI